MTRALGLRGTSKATAGMQVRVVGPESELPATADLRRLFSQRPLSPRRRERLAASAKVIATLGARLVGLASFERIEDEIRVHELAFDSERAAADLYDVLRQLIDALELACMASGGRRLVLLPTAVVAVSPFERMGYRLINEGCAGAWLEKIFFA
jgi:hypothetical protein